MKPSYAPYSIRLMLIIIGLSGILLSRFTGTWDVISIIIFIAQLVCLELMLKESTFFLTVYFRLVSLCIGVYLVGALLKILHWEGGDLLLLISVSGIALTYVARTANKKGIKILDIIKCLWVVAACAHTIVRLFHWRFAELLDYVNLILFVVMFVIFLISPEEKRKEDIPYKEKPFDQID